MQDLVTGRIRTGDIYYKEDRIRYVNQIDEENLPDLSNPTGNLRPLSAPPGERGTQTQKPRRSRASSRERKRFIPRGCVLTIDTPRINEIYLELKRLHVVRYSNAVAVLFRVFLELSLDDYIQRQELGIHEKAKLSHKMQEVGKDLESKGKLNEQQLKAVRRAAQSDTFLVATISTFNQYVHNPYFTPAPSDLNAAWDNLFPFVEAMWDA